MRHDITIDVDYDLLDSTINILIKLIRKILCKL